MDIRKLKPQEYRASDVLESLAFNMVIHAETDKQEADPYSADRWGCFRDGGQLHAVLTNHDMPVYLDGGIAPARGIGNLASDPVSRGQGNIRALLKSVLTQDRKDGMLFSKLYPFSHEFYRKFGYEICYERNMATFPTKELTVFRTGDPPEARMILPKDGLDALHPIYTAFAKQYNMAVARNAHTWKRIKIDDVFKAEKYCYVVSRDHRDVAYAIFRFRNKGRPFINTLVLIDYAFADRNAFNDLMSFLYRFTAQAEDVELRVPGNLPLTSLLTEPNDIAMTVGPKPMARALHVENVLKILRHPQEAGAYSLFVDDAFLPENTSCYRVSYTPEGQVSVSCGGEDADLRLSIGTFTQLAFGFLGLGEAAFKPDVQIRSNAETLARVFVKKPVVYWDAY